MNNRRIIARDDVWRVSEHTSQETADLYTLRSLSNHESLKLLAPPDEVREIEISPPQFSSEKLSPWGLWKNGHDLLRLRYAAERGLLVGTLGRIRPEFYQLYPVRLLLRLPRPRLLIADDVGLGKTIEAALCMLELMARGLAKRILIVAPPGLIPQWQDELLEKFGLTFTSLENAAAVDRAQTSLFEGISPWAFHDRVITSVEFLKKREIMGTALKHRWDMIIVDEAHYLAESGTTQSPYATARTRLGVQLRDACYSLVLLTATPHNGYRHSFRSLLELVEPAEATFEGDAETIRRRVERCMVRRLKPQIYKTGSDGQPALAFQPREPVQRLDVTGLSPEEGEIFRLVSGYCSKMATDARESEEAEIISFAMQIIKKRMLSSRAALRNTVENRLQALRSKEAEEPPTRAELRELQSELPISERVQERISDRILRSAMVRDQKRRNSEKRQLNQILKKLRAIEDRPDPKVNRLIRELETEVFSEDGEKAIIFTEYLDTLSVLAEAFDHHRSLKGAYTVLRGGLTQRQRLARIAEFSAADCRVLLATDAASEGLNLQRHCRRIYHFELPWNPNRLEQRNGRVDRHGQTRRPIIRYLHYPDSPEDQLLDRLVHRILEMQDDRVSTPDILGLVDGIPLGNVLTDLNADSDVEATSTSLFRVFEDRKNSFVEEMSPFLLSRSENSQAAEDWEKYSADTPEDDDEAFERAMIQRLGPALQSREIEHTYHLKIPRGLLGVEVQPVYPCVTFRRSVAVDHPGSLVEFIHRQHPVTRAIIEEARSTLTGQHGGISARLAVRRHSAAEKPFAIFTFLTQDNPTGLQISVAVSLDGEVLDSMIPGAVFSDTGSPGEVSWEECSETFADAFPFLQELALAAAGETQDAQRKEEAARRSRLASILREDAEKYRVNRLEEIDREARVARVGEAGQALLTFDSKPSGLEAKKAAVETHFRKRLESIAAFESPDMSADLQSLGVAFIFPPATS